MLDEYRGVLFSIAVWGGLADEAGAQLSLSLGVSFARTTARRPAGSTMPNSRQYVLNPGMPQWWETLGSDSDLLQPAVQTYERERQHQARTAWKHALPTRAYKKRATATQTLARRVLL